VELSGRLGELTGKQVAATVAYDYPSVRQLKKHMEEMVKGEEEDGGERRGRAGGRELGGGEERGAGSGGHVVISSGVRRDYSL
jgi:hypothetical protein